MEDKKLIDFAKEADEKIAEFMKIENQILDRSQNPPVPFSVCKTKAQQLEKFGIGLVLYLDFVKWLGLCFLALSCLYIPTLITNFKGNGYADDVGTFEKFTIGNLDTGARNQSL